MKNIKPFILILAAVLLAGLFLTACGGGEEPTPTPQPEPTATNVPPTAVPTPTEAPTAVPEPTEAPTAVPEPTKEPAGQTGEGVPQSQGFLLYGDTVSGEVTPGEISAWDFIGLEGETIDIIASPTDNALDLVVDVLDETGTSILESGPVDDSFGTEEIRGLTLPAQGTYYIAISGFADAAGSYQLTLAEAGTTAAPPSSSGETGSINYGDTVSGEISEPGAVSSWTFNADKGDIVGLIVTVNGDFDAVIDILDQSGASIRDGQRDATFGNEHMLVDLPEDGTYTIQVMGFEDSTGSFDLTLGEPMINSVFASAALTEEEIDQGDVYPFIGVEGEMVGIVVTPEESLDVAVLVEKDDQVVENIGYTPDRGFDTIGTEDYVFIVPETGVYRFVVRNSVDTEFGENTGTYDVELHGSGATVFELANGDGVASLTDESGYVEYAIRGLPDQTLTLEVEPYTDSDFMIELEDGDGNALTEAVNAGGVGEIETLTYTFTEDSTIFIRVSDVNGSANAVFVMNVTLE